LQDRALNLLRILPEEAVLKRAVTASARRIDASASDVRTFS
jgi:hypothetical protein